MQGDGLRSARTLCALAGSLLLAAGWWMVDRLPPPSQLVAETLLEPAQGATLREGFRTQRGGVDYRVRPVHDFALTGLVVSMHHADTWWDWIHAASNDHLNVTDLCVVWGANARDGAYQRMSFSSGQFVCYVETRDASAWQPPYLRALSNNHLLTDDPGIARTLRRVKVGDQIRISGELVEYAHDAGFAFTRGTSTSRDDTGNGACETVFLRDFAIVRAAPGWPRAARWLGALLLLAALVLHVAAPHRARD